ncbi:Endo-1,4-beta-xylanase A precursor [compost metagenome]
MLLTSGAQVADYARDAAAALVSAKLIDGYNGQIHPLGQATRAETAVFMYRIYMQQ